MTSATIATLLISSTFMPVRVEGPVTRAWFLSTYPVAAAHGEAVYDRLMIDTVCETPEGRNEVSRHTVRSTAFDGQLRLDVYEDASRQIASCYIQTPQDNVIVRRNVNERSRLPVTVEFCSADSLQSTIRTSFPFAFAPWHVGEHPLREVLTNGSVAIWDIRLREDPDVGCICDVHWSDTGETAVPPFGEFSFAVDRGWVLLSSVRMVSPRYGSVLRIAYDQHEVDGVPVIRTSEHSVVQEGRRILRRRFHRKAFVPLEAPPDIFDPTVYLVAAALSPQVPASTPLWHALMPVIMGVCLLAICVQGWRLQGNVPEATTFREPPGHHSENMERNRNSRE